MVIISPILRLRNEKASQPAFTTATATITESGEISFLKLLYLDTDRIFSTKVTCGLIKGYSQHPTGGQGTILRLPSMPTALTHTSPIKAEITT